MSRISLRAIATMVAVSFALCVTTVRAQDVDPDKQDVKADKADKNADKKAKDEAKLRDKERARAEREARRYEKLKMFAQELYHDNIDFRDAVDASFEDVQRQHSDEAFASNIAPPARPTVVHDGDRLRLQKGLYDNKMVADYINRVGQSLVPAESDKLFAFRLRADPVPSAETLSTGTIYVTTGLISLLDNEAQLAYVLAHEMAHVQLDHWKLKSMLVLAQDEFAKKEGAKRVLFGALVGAAAGVVAGGVSGAGAKGTAEAAASGATLGMTIAALTAPPVLDWDTAQENEADAVAFKAVLSRSYDVREVRTLYATLQSVVKQDSRAGLGFIGNRRRTAERLANVEELIRASAPNDPRQAKLVITHPEFVQVMATLKRDNGIMSFYRDMFLLAKINLDYARTNRPNDPAAHYYYAKVMKLVGRTDADRHAADEAFQRAIQFDHRERNYGAHFYRALALINEKNPALNAEIAKELQTYLMASMRFASEQAAMANALPANLDDMYDYLAEVGDVTFNLTAPETLKAAMIQAGTEAQKTESPLNRAKSGTSGTTTVVKTAAPIKRPVSQP